MSDQPSTMSGDIPPDAARRLEAVCNRFEAAWKTPTPPRIEDFLDGWTGAEGHALLRELVALDVVYRRKRGESPPMQEYLDRFADLDKTWLLSVLSPGIHEQETGPEAGSGGRHGVLIKAAASAWRPYSPQPPNTVKDLLEVLGRCRILEPMQTEGLAQLVQAASTELRALAKDLLERGWLTPYQVEEVLGGRGEDLLLGSYVLLDHVGLGGMGQVFKARNWKLGQVVAVKIIREDRLDNPVVRQRFLREIQTAAKLNHPNIVRAFDADEVDGTHLLVMEYVEGVDLAKVVKQHGRLPIAQACDYARQAAQGLQHAFEHGIVHRDVKPHNLLLTRELVVKILDMGLSRAIRSAGDGFSSAPITRTGMVVGTANYIAPEQIEEAHEVDIRADLYSLGCTLYHLLTGRVPFPGGDILQKFKRHLSEEPTPIEELRCDVPPDVAAVVRRLMAKRRENRYQTPTQAAFALTSVLRRGAAVESITANKTAVADGQKPQLLAGGPPEYAEDQTAGAAGAKTELAPTKVRRRPAAGRRQIGFYAASGLLLFMVASLSLAAFLHLVLPAANVSLPTSNQANPTSNPPEISDADFHQWLKSVAELPAEKQVHVVARLLKKRNRGFDGKVVPTIESGKVVGLTLGTYAVMDMSPIQALQHLSQLTCSAGDRKQSLLADLSPLKGLPLTYLDCSGTAVADLSPLVGMKLAHLCCGNTRIVDLSPLKGMPLTYLDCSGTAVADLSPLKSMKLTYIDCKNTPVSDLSPLQGMPLTALDLSFTKASDLSPLWGMPLIELSCSGTAVADLTLLRQTPLVVLHCDFNSIRDADALLSIPTLKTINGNPAAALVTSQYERALKRGREFAEIGRWEEAVTEFCRAVDLAQADATTAWWERARARARLGQWDQAKSDDAQALQLNLLGMEPIWYDYAGASIQSGRLPEYRKTCRQLLSRPDPANLEKCFFAARACILAPDAVDDLQRLFHLAEKAVAGGATPGRLYVLAAANYRAGQFGETVCLCNKSMEAGPWHAVCLDYLLLAMAHHHLGDKDTARDWLDKATREIETAEKARREQGADAPIAAFAAYCDWLDYQILHREAEDLLADK